MSRLRLPPYGPRMVRLGVGALIQAVSALPAAAGAPQELSDEVQEIGSPLGSTNMRPALTNVSAENVVRVRVEATLEMDASWTEDGAVLFSLEATTDVSLGWLVVGVSDPSMFANIRTLGEPSTYQATRQTVYFEADVPVATLVQLQQPGLATVPELTARVTVQSAFDGGSFLSYDETQLKVTIEELAGETADVGALRLPSAGPYRDDSTLGGGAVVKESVVRRPLSDDQAVTGVEAEITGNDPEGMRPALTPSRANARIRMIGQVILETDDAWETDTVDVSLQVSDDAGASWVELGLLTAQIYESLVDGAQMNPMRQVLAYQAEAELSAAFGDYAGGELIARATILREGEGLGTAVVTNDDGSVSPTWLKLQELA